jgi:hypothetical protein
MSVVPHTCARTHARTNKHTLARWQPDAHAHVHPHTHTHARARAHAHRRTHTGQARRQLAPCERVPPQEHAAPLGRYQRASSGSGGAARARRRRACEEHARVRRPVATFGETVGVRSAGRGRPGRDRCNDLDAQTDTRARFTHAHTRASIRRSARDLTRTPHTGARTCTRAATRSYADTTPTAAHTPPDAHEHTHARTHARTSTRAHTYG